MKILVAEYAVATGLAGTYQIEGKAMLSVLASSFQRIGHQVIYPTAGPRVCAGKPIPIQNDDFGNFLARTDADAGLVISPDNILPDFLRTLEKNVINLGSGPETSRLCADKLTCTSVLAEKGIPVVEVVDRPQLDDGPYVLKPRYGCGSENMEMVSSVPENDDRIATKYYDGEQISVSLVASGRHILPLTINKQLVQIENEFQYNGSQVPYRSDREEEILKVAEMAAKALNLRGYAGIDLVVSDYPRVVDVNPRPTTSIIGIANVMREELADLILSARFGSLPEKRTIEGECIFTKEELKRI
ncbi:MAG: ATP-grasp domain-containing protein [Methanotrichaceae archaeon]